MKFVNLILILIIVGVMYFLIKDQGIYNDSIVKQIADLKNESQINIKKNNKNLNNTVTAINRLSKETNVNGQCISYLSAMLKVVPSLDDKTGKISFKKREVKPKEKKIDNK